MNHKKILGLDLGTNSIGWAMIEQNFDEKSGTILGIGSRIIPMGAELSKFEQGQAQTKNANRRIARGGRKLNKRYKQRRNKLIYILQQLGMLPDHIKLNKPFDNPNRIDRVSILPINNGSKQLSALDLLELRVKALNEKIELKDLGKIFYLYNQLRGYSGGNAEPEKEDTDDNEDTDKKAKKESIITLCKINTISKPEDIVFKGKTLKKKKVEFEIDDERIDETILEADTFLDSLKVGETIELQINISNSKAGTNYQLKLPNKTSWRKKMENLEKELKDKTKEIGREFYIAEHLLDVLKENKWAKIRNNVVLRFRYESEFEAIWNKQLEVNESFKKLVENKELLNSIVEFIFPKRDESKAETPDSKKSKKEDYKKLALENGLKFLIKNQIIYYQRELKDQSDLISFCRFEPTQKVVSRSHPIFQEYRIWEQINKLNINTKIEIGKNKKGEPKYQYIDRPIPFEMKEWIYDELLDKKEIGFAPIFKKLIKDFNFQQGNEFLNGIDDKGKIKTNETIYILKKNLKEYWAVLNLNKIENVIELWDILYNGKGNEYDVFSDRTSKVLTFLKNSNIQHSQIEELAVQISKIKFARNYSSLSLKAINKILPLTKVGKYFENNLTNEIHDKMVKLLNENLIDPFEKSVQEYLENNIDLLVNGGIINAYAVIIVYNRHTTKNFESNEVISDYKNIERIKQGELRNPLAEQMINETLMIVKDIWKQFGFKPDEIRIELARELKNSADRRSKMHKSNIANQKNNEKVRERLHELKEEITLANIEKYKLWTSQENLSEEFISRYKDPTKTEVQKMKLWEEQGHISPYTGKVIPLSDLFDKGKYDIDHIIPKSRYFDDSLTNKVICETAVNNDKSNRTAMEYLEIGSTRNTLRKKDIYIDEVNKQFIGAKRKNLLATKVPDDPILRQIKDTQYIAVKVKEELNKIVGNDNVKSSTGGVTDYLRNQWGLTDKFKTILKNRYENLLENEKNIDNEYDKYTKRIDTKQKELKEIGKELNEIILDKEAYKDILKATSIFIKNNKLILKDWSKRIDHRHHAIDALTVACTSQAHIQRLNNLNKELQDWLEKNKKEFLPDFEGTPSELLDEIMTLDEAKRESITKQLEKFNQIEMPWKGFDFDALLAIEKIIVSQKPKDKLLIQKDTNGDVQIKIRGQLHEGTNYGKAGSGDHKVKNAETYRIPLIKLASKNFATEKTIEKIVNPYLKTKIKLHLEIYNNKKEDAFSAEGILELNNSLKGHTPISKIKIFYQDPLKKKINKNTDAENTDTLQKLDRRKAFNNSLYVKTGDNYLFAVLEKEEMDKKTKEVKTKRVFDIITFYDAANLLKSSFIDAEDKVNFDKNLTFKEYFEVKNRAKLLFTLKQGEYVYLPDNNEAIITTDDKEFWQDNKNRGNNIYIVQKYSGNRIYFIKHTIAYPIKKGIEFGSQDGYEKIANISIKDNCWKLEIDRLGKIMKIIK